MKKHYPPLFGSDPDTWNNACLNFCQDPTGGYIEGYRRAADQLVLNVETSQRDHDYFVFPVVFLYRHHMELLLKATIDHGRQLLDAERGYPTHHKIDLLWQEARRLVLRVWPKSTSEALAQVDHVVKEISEVDRFSMAFRYPHTKDGSPSIPELTHINLRNVREQISAASECLAGVLLEFEHRFEVQCEIQSYYRDYY